MALSIKPYYQRIVVIICLAGVNLSTTFGQPLILNGTETTIEVNGTYTFLCEGDQELTWNSTKSDTDPKSTNKPTLLQPEYYANWTSITVKDDRINDKYISLLSVENMSYPYVGFYSCYFTANPSILSSIYVFVNDYNQLSVSNNSHMIINALVDSWVVLPCRPTFPNVNVTLVENYDEVLPNRLDPRIGFNVTATSSQSVFECEFEFGGKESWSSFSVHTEAKIDTYAKLKVSDQNYNYTVVGEDLTLICAINVNKARIKFRWIGPKGPLINDSRMNVSQNDSKDEESVEKLTLSNVTLADRGSYVCDVRAVDQEFKNNASITVKISGKNEHYLNISRLKGYTMPGNATAPYALFGLTIKAQPKPTLTWYDNKNETISNETSKKYKIESLWPDTFGLRIFDIKITDFGNYTLQVSNGYETESKVFFFNVTDKPSIEIEIDKFYMINQNSTVKCIGTGNPPPNISWAFSESCSNCNYESISDVDSEQDGFRFVSRATINASQSGYIKCSASNSQGSQDVIQGFHITDINNKNGFEVLDIDGNSLIGAKTFAVATGEAITMKCGGSKLNYTDIEWFVNGTAIRSISGNRYNLSFRETTYSIWISLTVSSLTLADSGSYECKTKVNESISESIIIINMTDPQKPLIKSTNMNPINFEWKLGKQLDLFCDFSGIPKPKISWVKDNKEVKSTDRIQFSQDYQNLTFTETEEGDEGEYECRGVNKAGTDFRRIQLIITNKPGLFANKYVIIIIVGLIMLVFIAGIIIADKVRKERKLQRDLEIAGLANFKKGAVDNLNFDIGIDDQAELLPYEQKWEFPLEKLKLGKQLGSGAFGVVLKGEADGILEKDVSTTVAVKMVKRDTDYSYTKALASELKIMVHLGKHLNVVNLLGACTKNVAKRELLVIVEYCRYGNLQQFLFRHRNNFIDQINQDTGTVDYTIGQDLLLRTYSGLSDRQSQIQTPPINNTRDDYRKRSNYVTGRADVTLLSVNQTSNGFDEGALSSNSSQAEQWPTNYNGDSKGFVKPICTLDLLNWSFQVCEGMKYLSSRNLLHGDLAARNILLADNDIVKICDFGLSKDMYKKGIYKKESKGLLPMKWMAIESICDKIFSTQSDVWSYGIVLWEFFSLAQTPYPTMEPDDNFYNKLVNGYRMEQPILAPNLMYKLMQDCWQSQPTSRPSFNELSEQIGDLLPANHKAKLIYLNNPFLSINNQRLEDGQTDYLAMVHPPTFENLSSPNVLIDDVPVSPCSLDTPGYLSMQQSNLFSPRPNPYSNFNFDDAEISKIKNVRVADAEQQDDGIELTPLMRNRDDPSVGDTSVMPNSNNRLSSDNNCSNPTYHIVSSVIDSANKKDNCINVSHNNYVNLPQNQRIAVQS